LGDRFIKIACRYLTVGFYLHQDIHDDTATIREAFEFSALPRQPTKETPHAEKLAYIDEIISLLELGLYQDVMVRNLSVDLKKRTLGIELSTKPSHILFLMKTPAYFFPLYH
jgi:ATP-binding cassette, subfamily G (WHITE), member 2, SNQ2